jgi:hypothetical protein
VAARLPLLRLAGFWSAARSRDQHDVGEGFAFANGDGVDFEADVVQQLQPVSEAAAVERWQAVAADEGDDAVAPVADVVVEAAVAFGCAFPAARDFRFALPPNAPDVAIQRLHQVALLCQFAVQFLGRFDVLCRHISAEDVPVFRRIVLGRRVVRR